MFMRFVWIAVAVVVGVLGAWTLFTLNWSYSDGERAGYVQKLSERGWICKTWEGEMAMVTMPGTVAEKFYFTVPDDAVAQEINKTVGIACRVALRAAQVDPDLVLCGDGVFRDGRAGIRHSAMKSLTGLRSST